MSQQAQPRKRRGLQDKYIWQAGDVQASTYRGPRPKVGEEEEKARSLPKTGGRWRTLRDGRRVYVTGARQGVTGSTWRNSSLVTRRRGELESMRDEDRETSVSPDYLLHTGVDKIEAWDVMGFEYLDAGVLDNVNRDAVDFNEELARIGHTREVMVDALADPKNEVFFGFIDRDGDAMVGNARLAQEGNFGLGMNVVFTHSEENAGAGSGGLHGGKVFYAPYDGRSESLQRYMRQDGLQDLGFDPISVTAHELHHALGSHTELDLFTEVMGVASHYSLGNELFQRNVDSTVYSWVNTARSRARNTKDSPTWASYVRKHRAAVRWMYDRHPKQFRDSFIRQAGGEQYAGDYWKTLEKKIKSWKTSYPTEGD